MLLAEFINQLRQRGFGNVSPNCVRWHADQGMLGDIARDWKGHRTFSIENLNKLSAILASRNDSAAKAAQPLTVLSGAPTSRECRA